MDNSGTVETETDECPRSRSVRSRADRSRGVSNWTGDVAESCCTMVALYWTKCHSSVRSCTRSVVSWDDGARIVRIGEVGRSGEVVKPDRDTMRVPDPADRARNRATMDKGPASGTKEDECSASVRATDLRSESSSCRCSIGGATGEVETDETDGATCGRRGNEVAPVCRTETDEFSAVISGTRIGVVGYHAGTDTDGTDGTGNGNVHPIGKKSPDTRCTVSRIAGDEDPTGSHTRIVSSKTASRNRSM